MTQAIVSNTSLKLLPLCLILGACTVGPKYQTPEIDTGNGWSTSSVKQTEPVKLQQWWLHFDDPVLNDLIEQARSQNLDLRQALARIEEARALRDAARGRLYPQVDARSSITRRRQSENGPLPIDRIPGLETTQTIFEAGFDASWELDFFGRNRRRIDATQARLEEREAQANDMMLSVTAEVARSYMELRGAQQEALALNALIETSSNTLEFIQTRVRLGENAMSEAIQAQAELAEIKAQLPVLESRVTTSALSIGLLLGQLPEATLNLTKDIAKLAVLSELPVGKRADLLRRRADIRAAERRLAAATEELGLAHAELFPKLVIAASGGFQSLSAGSLLEGGSGTWLLAPLLTWRVFDSGRVKAEIRASEARSKQAALAYEHTVIKALSEAEQALVRYKLNLEALALQSDAVTAAEENQRHASLRYEAGDSTKLVLLHAERALSNAKQKHASAHTHAASSLIQLFKTLGGGWHEVL